MADIGRYLTTEPVNCIVFVIEPNLTIRAKVRSLVNLILTKLHPNDHDKVAVVVNHWSHTNHAKQARSCICTEDEVAIKDECRDYIVQAFSGTHCLLYLAFVAGTDLAGCDMHKALCADSVNEHKLKLCHGYADSLHKRIFFVDSQYNPNWLDVQDNDKQAFVVLMDYCSKCGCINRGNVAQDTCEWVWAVRVICLNA